MCDTCSGCLVSLCMKSERAVEFVRIKLIGMNYSDCALRTFLLICSLVSNDLAPHRVPTTPSLVVSLAAGAA